MKSFFRKYSRVTDNFRMPLTKYIHMRYPIYFGLFLLFTSTVYAQNGTTGIAMGQEFSELAAHGGLSGKGFAAFQSYSSTDVRGSQFFFPDWTSGELVTNRKEVFNTGLQFLYDKVRQ